jgi:hypothetical protein
MEDDGVDGGVLPLASSHAVEPHLHEVCKESLRKVRKIVADNGVVFFEEPVNVEEPSGMCLKMVEVRQVRRQRRQALTLNLVEGEGSHAPLL